MWSRPVMMQPGKRREKKVAGLRCGTSGQWERISQGIFRGISTSSSIVIDSLISCLTSRRMVECGSVVLSLHLRTFGGMQRSGFLSGKENLRNGIRTLPINLC
ncbi:unnamed protein product [Spirodela intermedia]|uniref:Uncharacterized protein n=1 Tax=Spirodela intermedia TaxID=51605 RepID=A0A7I8J9Z8_SPIIN|nr:unnamed protein product [Spirodela intermedia]CAA6666272.1 unnamed protein product [Spirodela intermedia]